MKSILIFSALITALINCRAEDIEVRKQGIMNELLNPKSYEKRIRPGGDNPTVVNVTAYIIDIPDTDEILKDYTVQMYFRQNWVDERLIYADRDKPISSIYVTDIEKIWTPDLFFINEVTGQRHDIMTPNQLMRVSPDGKVLYSVRITSTFTCNADLKYYPHDQQTCTIDIESFKYVAEEIALQWESDRSVMVSKQVDSNSQFRLTGHKESVRIEVVNDKEYSRLRLELQFTRKFSVFLHTVYIPSILLVVLSWGSFWLDTKQVLPRLSYVVLLMYFMLYLMSGAAEFAMQVTAMDVWEGICLAFLFAAFAELIVVNQMARWDEAKKSESEQSEIRDAESGNMKEEKPKDKDDKSARGNRFLQKFVKKHQTRSNCLDAVCRIVFPILFLLFNIIYWPVCYSNYK